MPQDVEIAIVHGPNNTLGLFVRSQGESRMYRADRIIELAQQVVWIVERSVGENVHLGGFQDVDAIEPCVQLVDEPDLLP